MIEELKYRLKERERKIVLPVFDIDSEILASGVSKIEESNEFVLCKFFCADHTRCPFEIHFGRNENVYRFNFYIGLGAELYNYEDFSNDKEKKDIEQDIERFLRSTIHCEQHISKKGIMRAIYSPTMFVVDGIQIRFSYKADYFWPFFKYEKKVINYRPWI